MATTETDERTWCWRCATQTEVGEWLNVRACAACGQPLQTLDKAVRVAFACNVTQKVASRFRRVIELLSPQRPPWPEFPLVRCAQCELAVEWLGIGTTSANEYLHACKRPTWRRGEFGDEVVQFSGVSSVAKGADRRNELELLRGRLGRRREVALAKFTFGAAAVMTFYDARGAAEAERWVASLELLTEVLERGGEISKVPAAAAEQLVVEPTFSVERPPRRIRVEKEDTDDATD